MNAELMLFLLNFHNEKGEREMLNGNGFSEPARRRKIA